MKNEELIFILETALVYVQGAYECAFPDDSENEYVANEITRAIEELKKDA